MIENHWSCSVCIYLFLFLPLREREQMPHFAQPGTFEFEYASRWKGLHEMEKQQREQVDKNIKEAKEKLEAELESAKHEHQLMMMRQGSCLKIRFICCPAAFPSYLYCLPPFSPDLMRRQEELRRLEELRNQELQRRKQIEMRFVDFLQDIEGELLRYFIH